MWSDDQFLQAAQRLQHPFDKRLPLPCDVGSAIFKILTEGPTQIQQQRLDSIKRYTALATELEGAEGKLHRSLSKGVAKVINGKRILLFKRMLEDIAYDDMGVVEVLTVGVRITGTLPAIGIWKLADNGAKLHPHDLWQAAP